MNREIIMGCCEPVLGPVENYYTKPTIDRMLDEISSAITSGCCITPEEVDEKIASAKTQIESEIPTVPTSNTAFTNDAGYLTEHQHIKTINGQSLVGDGDIEIGTGGTIDLSNYYTTAQTVNLVESAVTRVEGEIPTVPTSNTAFTNDAGYLTEHQSLSGYATEQWVEDKHYITGVDLSNYATKAEIPVVPTSNTAFTNDAGYITGVDLSNYATKDNLTAATDDMATKTWANNQGYLTEHQSLTAYSTTQEVNTMINQSVSGKQDTLSAGTNITIVDNVISAQGGGATYTAGTGIDITNNVISAVIKFWCGTMSEYEQISQHDNNTIYLIHS